jgi:BASS family bile acid:Na+ symporter
LRQVTIWKAGINRLVNEIDELRVVLNSEARTVVACVLAGMMFTVALSLKVADFTALKRQPVKILGGVLAQTIGLPALTMGLVLILSPPPSIALGMFVVAACPGGNMSNLFTHFARGHTAYSVSLTAISSVLSAFMTPVSILFWSGLYEPTAQLVDTLSVEPWPFLMQTTALLALPLMAGMAVAAKLPKAAIQLRKFMMPLSVLALIAIIVLSVWSNWTVLLVAGTIVIPLTIIHNLSAFGLGAAAGRILRLDAARRRSITFEVGIQNAGLGLLILLGQFQGLGGAAAITAFWGVWHLIAGGALVSLFRAVDHFKQQRAALGTYQ